MRTRSGPRSGSANTPASPHRWGFSLWSRHPSSQVSGLSTRLSTARNVLLVSRAPRPLSFSMRSGRMSPHVGFASGWHLCHRLPGSDLSHLSFPASRSDPPALRLTLRKWHWLPFLPCGNNELPRPRTSLPHWGGGGRPLGQVAEGGGGLSLLGCFDDRTEEKSRHKVQGSVRRLSSLSAGSGPER